MPLFLLLACSKVSAPISAPDSAPVENNERAANTEPLCNFKSDREACLGKPVKWKGEVPEGVHVHPILSSPSVDAHVQSYIEVEDRQYILLLSEPHGCTAKMEAQGTLNQIDLGGEPGTRGSYRNFYISDATVRCLN
jgi:hypothetical protein